MKIFLYDFQHSSVIMKSFFFYIAFNLNYASEYTWATKFYTIDFFNKLKSHWKKIEKQWSTLLFVEKVQNLDSIHSSLE